MSDKKKDKAPIDFDFSHIGGKTVGHPVPVQTETEISFEHLGGKCVLKPSDHPMFNVKPEESIEKGG